MAKQTSVKQVALLSNMTSSKTGTFYFAFGSNLSTSQMELRLSIDLNSSKPVAVARLDAHAWIICMRGYANVVALPTSNAASHENTVWGLLYNLSAGDEARLDMYEGHDNRRNPQPQFNHDPTTQQKKPYLQGEWDYNKQYLPLTVTKWLQNPNGYGVEVPGWTSKYQQPTSIRGLVYVDEMRTQPGKINLEYIGRMNRAIREGTDFGIPQDWVNAVLRKYIPAGVEVDHEDYVGTDQGYVEAEATETASDLRERVIREQQSRVS